MWCLSVRFARPFPTGYVSSGPPSYSPSLLHTNGTSIGSCKGWQGGKQMAHCREYILISLYLSTCRCLTSFDLPLLGSPQSSKLDLNVLRWGCFLAPVKYTGLLSRLL